MLVKIDWTPDRRKLRHFGIFMLVAFVVIGALVAWRLDAPRAPWVCGAIGVVFCIAGVAVPPAGLWLYRAWMGLGWCMGTVLSPVFLAVVYFGVFTPVALALRLTGRDFLALRRGDGASFWRPIHHRTDVRSYERQF